MGPPVWTFKLPLTVDINLSLEIPPGTQGRSIRAFLQLLSQKNQLKQTGSRWLGFSATSPRPVSPWH